MSDTAIVDKELVIDKIRKLLNLADTTRNGSIAEAESALLMAQKLMAKHNVTVDMSTPEKITHATEICEHKWDMGYRKPLAGIIAKNFRCEFWLQGKSVAFLGRVGDVKIARETFEFAYEFIMLNASRAYNSAYQLGKPTKGVFNSYALGFLKGIGEKFGEQSRALMIITPPDVTEKFNDMSKNWKTARGNLRPSTIDHEVYTQGYHDCKTAIGQKRLKK